MNLCNSLFLLKSLCTPEFEVGAHSLLDHWIRDSIDDTQNEHLRRMKLSRPHEQGCLRTGCRCRVIVMEGRWIRLIAPHPSTRLRHRTCTRVNVIAYSVTRPHACFHSTSDNPSFSA